MKSNFTKILIGLLFLAPAFANAQSQPLPQPKTPAEKQAWVKANNDLQSKRTARANTQKTTVKKTKVKNDNNTPSGQLVNEPGFPAYVNTGDKVKDDANYKIAKDNWIKDHPDRYKVMTNAPQKSN